MGELIRMGAGPDPRYRAQIDSLRRVLPAVQEKGPNQFILVLPQGRVLYIILPPNFPRAPPSLTISPADSIRSPFIGPRGVIDPNVYRWNENMNLGDTIARVLNQ